MAESAQQESSEVYANYKQVKREKSPCDGTLDETVEVLAPGPLLGEVKPIVVTGFGVIDPIYNPQPNISASIMKDFFLWHGGYFEHDNSEKHPILTNAPENPPTTPVVSMYRYMTDPEFYFDDWLRRSDARLYVHLGILVSNDHKTNPIYLEKVAYNYPVHPDGKPWRWERDFEGRDNDRQPCFSDGDEYLVTDFDVSELRKKVEEKIADPRFSFRESNNAGRFLCDFLYYRSLYYAQKRNDWGNVLLSTLWRISHLKSILCLIAALRRPNSKKFLKLLLKFNILRSELAREVAKVMFQFLMLQQLQVRNVLKLRILTLSMM